jgi:hypothetical protein
MPGVDESARQERIALNEVTFRQANETLRKRFPDPDDRGLDPYPFLCECGDRRCTRVVEVPLDVYAEIREHPARFLTLPGHAMPDAEVVIQETDRYEVVEKRGRAGEIARSHWPSGFFR